LSAKERGIAGEGEGEEGRKRPLNPFKSKYPMGEREREREVDRGERGVFCPFAYRFHVNIFFWSGISVVCIANLVHLHM
jgi:hypothetical protein